MNLKHDFHLALWHIVCASRQKRLEVMSLGPEVSSLTGLTKSLSVLHSTTQPQTRCFLTGKMGRWMVPTAGGAGRMD